jgi:penicillin-binding protein 2
MTAGIKPGELPSGDVSLAADPNAMPKPKPNSATNSAQNHSNTQGHRNNTPQPATAPSNEADISE